MKIEELVELQEEIEERKTEYAQLEGEKKAILQQLKDGWDCKTVKQAEEKIKSIESEVEVLNTEIEDGLEELEKSL
jgi:hypothetical protein